MKLLLLVAAGFAFVGGAAQAGTADALMAAAYRTPRTATVAIPLPPRGEAPRPAGVARTSLDHRFDRDGLDGSLGFLCGLQPSAATSGAAAATGVDPHGRFLGVQLKMPLR